ncbi:HAD family hydrolase [Flammeovirgaceae bacterium SG7u.111]|nr:HAD family hydrolase [Flammeovirgaceae bacterium SG7u.132]WPO36265.1 HAD family hydrolase [Flammeovirgaceae bacterium SG7u.111]
MGKSNHPFILFIAILFFFSACSETKPTEAPPEVTIDPLPSWNDGEAKAAIVDFVEKVTDSNNPSFVDAKDRVATFDNDGNLWSEQPMYFQLLFVIDRVKELAPEHPEWAEKQPFKAVLENDMETVAKSGEHGLLELMMATHAGMTTEEFAQTVKNWLETATHPRFKRPYTELVYQPMLELLYYLSANEFKTFIVSGGGVDFMRVWVEEVYGIPNDQVVGSSIKTEFVMDENGARIMRLPEIDFIDDKAGKPVGIHKFIGRRPIFASGNSDGDLQMLQWTDAGEGASFKLYLHHTDSVREWAYDRESHIGRLDKGLDEAGEKGWTVIDMQEDWKLVYPFELSN